MNSKMADTTGDQGFLSNIGNKLQDMAGAAAEKLSTTTNGGRDLMQPSMNDTQPIQQSDQSFHSEYKTNDGQKTGKAACVAAQNNPTPGKCCPEHNQDEAKDYGKRVFM
ncbi:unnamed protein product [Cylicocyclus nassatus]|uniref:Uncharacterized protein n=1 Tax=Cylicocyclus nassatus TaxID=53992 RepID=A0AA36HAT3_CYLNA|nr:unnamed protein product [Cylicocyclus nassatus]